jgi:aspartyl-tRNA(Asn)/glutamyl-tRNA(Gln) amidotransferase subunit C
MTSMKLDVTHVAKLANLPLSDEEIKKFEKQLDETLTYIDNLQEVDTKNVKPTAHVTREDVAKDSLDQKDALANAKSTHEGFFQVNAILDNE